MTTITFRGKKIPLAALRVVRLWSPDKEIFYLTLRDVYGEHDSFPMTQDKATEKRDKLLALLADAKLETWIAEPDCSLVLSRVQHVGMVLPSAIGEGNFLLEIVFSDLLGDAHVVHGKAEALEELRQALLAKGIPPF